MFDNDILGDRDDRDGVELEDKITPEGVVIGIDCPDCDVSFSIRLAWDVIGYMKQGRKDLKSLRRHPFGYTVMVKCWRCMTQYGNDPAYGPQEATRLATKPNSVKDEDVIKWLRIKASQGK